jgi:Cu+-exporting ATPase
MSDTKTSTETITCYHCGDDCDREHVLFDEKDFCCNGCKTVYEILNQNDLCTYYDLDKNPGISLKSKKFDDKYAFLDNEEIAHLILDFKDTEIAKVTFFIPSIHCSSCIWLLENLYKLTNGVNHSRVNFVKKEFSVDFNPLEISLRSLVELLATLGYEPNISLDDSSKKTSKSINRSLYLKIGVAGFAFGNIMLLSFPEYFGFQGLEQNIRKFLGYLNIFLSLPVVFYCAGDYFTSAYTGLREKFINIDVPISLGIIVLFSRSLYEILSMSGPGYLDSLSGLLFFLLVGRWFQNYTYQGLSFERDYKSYFPLAVFKKDGQDFKSIPVNNLDKGDIIRVRNHEIIPVDSILESAQANIDYSFVTGESNPVSKNQGEYIYAGGRQMGEGIELNVVKPVSQSYLTQLWNNDAFTKEKDDTFQLLINKISKYFTVAVLVLAVAGFVFWLNKDLKTGLNALTAVLIVACPCALTLSAPFTLGSTMRIFGRKHFYLKNVNVIERLLQVTHLVFDKTGTITYNQESVVRFEGDALNHDEMRNIKAVAMNSSHPLSRLLAENIDDVADNISVERFEEISGAGLQAYIDGDEYKLGSWDFVNVAGTAHVRPQDATQVFISKNTRLLGRFKIENKYRDGIKDIVSSLQGRFKFSILTGDNQTEEQRLIQLFGASSTYKFKQSPQNKLDYIRNLQEKNENVLMIGDGLNDAGALRQSDVGISVTDDTTNFTPASDAIMTSKSIQLLPDFINFSRTAHRIVVAAFTISFLYNIVGISFALSGQLTPLVAAILMPLSSISVVVFATTTTNLMAKVKKLI